MRREFSNIIENVIKENKNAVFITGDLGFSALENVQATANDRFINAGVAEQNMIGVAAGLAYKGFEVFTYSIAPFIVYRCLEQIKIDVCIHNMPVYIVGNGGGYGYGIMGATHHALEDIACLSVMPNMTCWVPAFKEDVGYCLFQITSQKKPAYLRLGLAKAYPENINISAINKVKSSDHPQATIIALGPIVHNVLDAVDAGYSVNVFTVLTIPILKLSEELINSIKKSKKVLVVEEHVERGGLAEHLLLMLAKISLNTVKFVSLNAKGYPNKLYGDQAFHQKESGLDTENIKRELAKLIS